MLYTCPSPIGLLAVRFKQQKITEIKFNAELESTKKETDPFVKTIHNELHHYFKNPHYLFQIDFELNGTEFQQRVWRAIKQIPVGTTLTYGQLATKLKTSARAIGNACRTNPVPLLIPCHRVVSKTGLGGFNGDIEGKNLEIKKWLLSHELGFFMNVPSFNS